MCASICLSTKSQAPNSKQAPITEIRNLFLTGSGIPKRSFWSFGNWNLGFIWDLEFEI
jgi:hypothetical protein